MAVVAFMALSHSQVLLLKGEAASTEDAHATRAAAAAAAAVADSVSVSSKPAVVPVGAEAAGKAAAGKAAAGKAAREAMMPCAQQQQQQQQQQRPVGDQKAVSQLKLGDIRELVLFFIPDGHSKHE